MSQNLYTLCELVNLCLDEKETQHLVQDPASCKYIVYMDGMAGSHSVDLFILSVH